MHAVPAHTIRSAIAAAVIAGTGVVGAQAQDSQALEAELAGLSADAPADLMRGVIALCLLNLQDRQQVVHALKSAGWTVAGEGQWIEADRKDVWATLLGEDTDYSCDVQGGIPQSESEQMIWDLMKATKFKGWEITHTEDACNTFTHTSGAEIFLSSAGNDPTCDPTPDSGITVVSP